MDRAFKILVTGPFDSGKTTFIGTISEIEVLSTERNTKADDGSLASTTVAMDFGRITFPDGYVLHIYGTPGQERFDFMWEVLSEGMLGYVVLLDGSDPSTFAEAGKIIEVFGGMSDVPYVVGITWADRGDCLDPEAVARGLAAINCAEMLRCDARNRQDVKSVLVTLLELVLARAEERDRRQEKRKRSLAGWPDQGMR